MFTITLMTYGLEKYITGVFETIELQEPGDQAVNTLITFIKTLKKRMIARARKQRSLTRRNFFAQATEVLEKIKQDLTLEKYSIKIDDKLMYRAWARIRIFDLRNIINC